MEFQVRYLALFLLSSVIGSFRWFWMGNLHKSIQLMLEFLKSPFLVLNFSYYTLMTFLMMSSVILLSMLIVLSSLNVVRHLICGNNQNWLLNLNLIYLIDVHLNGSTASTSLFLRGLFVILIDCMIFLSPFLDVTRMSMSTVPFLTQLDSGILCL